MSIVQRNSMSTDKQTDRITECRFATYVRSKDDYENDAHFIKEQIHDPVSGKLIPNLRRIKK